MIKVIFDQIKDLEGPTNESQKSFAALQIPDFEHYRIGKGKHNFPSLLIQVKSCKKELAPLKLEHLEIHHDIECTVNDESNHRSFLLNLSVITCCTKDTAMQEIFFELAGHLMQSLGSEPKADEVAERVESLIKIFRRLSEPSRKTIQGLWAELFLISQSRDPETLIAAWHKDPVDRIDFNGGTTRLEVKSSSTRVREHFFSMEQLVQPAQTSLVIASLFVESSRGGVTANELLSNIKRRVSLATCQNVYEIFYATLGNNVHSAANFKFDWELAKNSLRYYSLDKIPKLDVVAPPEVTNIKFKSNLTACEPMSAKNLRELGGLLQATCPSLAVGSKS